MYAEPYPINAVVNAHGEITSAQDWLGNRFSVGDKVIYCVARVPRSGKMALGRVTKIRRAPEPQGGYHVGEGIEVQIKTVRTTVGAPAGFSPQWIVPSNVTALSGLEDYAADMFADVTHSHGQHTAHQHTAQDYRTHQRPIDNERIEPHHRAARSRADNEVFDRIEVGE